jgi:hypothetical protein
LSHEIDEACDLDRGLEGRRARAREIVLPGLRRKHRAAGPSHPIAQGRAGPSLLAMFLASKFLLHQPLNRQSETYAREAAGTTAQPGLNGEGIRCWVGLYVCKGWKAKARIKRSDRRDAPQGDIQAASLGLDSAISDTTYRFHGRSCDSSNRASAAKKGTTVAARPCLRFLPQPR